MGACCTSATSGTDPFLPNRNTEKKDAMNKKSDFEYFDHPYLFKRQNVVVIRHHANGLDLQGKSLCVHDGDKKSMLYGDGEVDIFSKFEAFPDTASFDYDDDDDDENDEDDENKPFDGDIVKFKSLHNGKFIRIISIMSLHETKNVLDCNCVEGVDDKFCIFKVHHLAQDGHVKLESAEC